jgi:hypothetical protein
MRTNRPAAPSVKRAKAQNAVSPISSMLVTLRTFSCLPSRAERFREIIRAQFALAEALKQARADLGDKKYKQVLSCLPQYGDLDIELMREAARPPGGVLEHSVDTRKPRLAPGRTTQ